MTKAFFLVSILIFFSFLFFCGCKKSTVVSPNPGGDSYTQSTQTLDIGNGNQMQYAQAIPPSYSGETVPLIVALHYGAENSAGVGREFLNGLILPALKELNAIIVAPDAPQGNWYGSISEQAVMKLVEHVTTEFNIDKGRVLVTGFSMGGIGTWHFAAMFPETFSAAVALAGMPTSEAQAQWGTVPIYVIHGRSDDVFPVTDVEALVNQLKAEGKPIEAKFIDGLSHYDVAGYVQPLKDTINWIQTNL